MEQLRIIIEQNGMINLFSMMFSTLLFFRTRRGYIEKLLLITSYSGFIGDCMLVFTNGPESIRITNLGSIRAMTFFEVIFWTIRELGLTLYTNKLIKVLDTPRIEKIYYIVYNIMFILICIWRMLDMSLRTYDPYVMYIEGDIVMIGNLVYLGALSCIDIWSSIFLLKLSSVKLKDMNPSANVYKIIKEIFYSGVLRIVLINTIPLIRLILSLAVTSSFNYENNVSVVVYELQASMNMMYLIDISIIKINVDNIFRFIPTNHIELNQRRSTAYTV